MYIPAPFLETGRGRLLEFIRNNSFGVLVSSYEGRPYASHLPFLLDADFNGNARLLGHMARANPQWQSFDRGETVLAIFQGPHGYVSPSWYLTPGVPTWNYAVAQVYGSAHSIRDPEAMRNLLDRLTHEHESQSERPWKREAFGARFEELLDAIVGFEIRVTDIQGKFKLSQNRPPQDRVQVVEQLRKRGGLLDAALADLMDPTREI